MSTFEAGLISEDDLLQIQNVLYSPKEQELVHRTMFNMSTGWDPAAREIGYDYYQRQGSAKILGSGGGANDLPFVGEKGGRVTQQVYTVATGIRLTRAEQMAIQAKRSLGKGPSTDLFSLRSATARRFIFEKEHALTFAGDSEFSIKGIFDSTFYGTNLGTKENVAQGATGATAAAKRLWSNKTAQEILTDLQTAKDTLETDGIFTARVLALPPLQYNKLFKPFSTTNDSRTLYNWLRSEGMMFEQIIKTNAVKTTNNGDTVDYMFVFDNDPEVVELSLINDISLLDPVYNAVGTMEMGVVLDTAGIICRHPSGLYVGKGI